MPPLLVDDIHYYNQGDLAYALAAATSDHSEIEKYRRLLAVILEGNERMASESRANLFYSMGKIDLLLNDKNRAKQDLQKALDGDKSLILGKSKQDELVRDFLVSTGLN
jgi:hypothetical protein